MAKKTIIKNKSALITAIVLAIAVIFVYFESYQKTSSTTPLDTGEMTYDQCKARYGSSSWVKKVEDNFFDYLLTCESLGITVTKYATEGGIISWSDSEPRFSDVDPYNKSVYTYQSPYLSETANWYSEVIDESWTLVEAIGGDPLRYKLIANQENHSLDTILQNLKYGNKRVIFDSQKPIEINKIPGYKGQSGTITYYILKHPDTTQVLMYRYSNLKEKEISVYEKIIHSSKYYPLGLGIKPYDKGGQYHEEQYKFQITLPDNWYYHKIEGDKAISTTFTAHPYLPITEFYPNHAKLEISITTAPNLTKEEFIKTVSDAPDPEFGYETYEEIEINSQKGIKLTRKDTSDALQRVSYHFWNSLGWQYDIRFYSWGKFKNNPQLIEQATQITNSFTLLPQ